MNWTIAFILSLVIFTASVVGSTVLSRIKYKSGRLLNSENVLVIGTALSAMCLFFPVYRAVLDDDIVGLVKSLVISAHNTIRLFVVDADFMEFINSVPSDNMLLRKAILLLASILYIMAPILTFGFVLSFFKNLAAYRGYLFGYFKETYVFSELNDKSLELARSLHDNNPRRLIVFTDVYEKNDEEKSSEIVENAKEIGAILFKKDILGINFNFHYRKAGITFFTIGLDDSENLKHTVSLIEKYRNRENTSIYSFTTKVDGQILLNRIDKGKIKVRRVNESRSFVNRTVYENGEKLFANAKLTDSGIKEISVVVLGMGTVGSQMVRTLSWFCQMYGYSLRINAFDKDPDAESVFRAACPELLDERYNRQPYTDADANYDITIHSGMAVDTYEFEERIKAIGNVTYVLVSLGDDDENIRTSVNLRKVFSRLGTAPQIQSIVFNSYSCSALKGVTNFKGVPYDIDFIGDLKASYSESVILSSEIESLGYDRHLSYLWNGADVEKYINDFWNYEYNYMSSLASAMHTVMKKKCDIPGINKPKEERTEEELNICRRVEHQRWNAYMRAEGYCFAPSRDDMAKLHHCLIRFDDLPYDQQIKDDD